MEHRLVRAVSAALLAVSFLGLSLWAVPAPAASGASSGIERTDDPAGGSILAGTFGGSSLSAATAALLRRVHSELGSRPNVIQVAQNQKDHSLALLFTAARGGTPYTGVAIMTASPGSETTGAALYDTSSRFHTTVTQLVQRLQEMTAPGRSAAAPVHLAPAEPLVQHPFSDGTGSISVPANWQVTAGGGSAIASAPGKGAQVSYNMDFGGLDPSNPRAQMFLRTASPMARAGFHGILSPFIADPVKAWVTIFSALAKRNGMPASQIHITSQTHTGPNAATFTGTLGSGSKRLRVIGYAFVLPPNPMGMWKLSDTHLFIPDSVVAQQGETANAVLDSVHINFGAVAQQQSAIRKMFQQKFETEIANDRAQDQQRYEHTQQFLAQDRAAQEGMHRQAVAMENYSLDRAVVVDTRTGGHATVGSNFADTLVAGNRNFQKVPASGLLRGVDY